MVCIFNKVATDQVYMTEIPCGKQISIPLSHCEPKILINLVLYEDGPNSVRSIKYENYVAKFITNCTGPNMKADKIQ